MENYSEIQQKTKEIYINQHKNYLKDKNLFDRFYKVAVNPATYGLNNDFFRGIKVLDAGCGNSAYFQKAMYDLEVSHITCIDIGDSWIPELQSALDFLEIPREFYSLIPGSTTKIPCDDNYFDLVASNGVLMHLDGIEEAELAFSELSRVTKKGGALYTYCGVSNAGITDKYILPALREAYQKEDDFKKYVDEINPETIRESFLSYISLMESNDPSVDTQSLVSGLDLITLDTCTFIQNALQVPINQGASLNLEWAEEQYRKNGFIHIKRVPERYWQRKDIRKFLAPVHFDRDNILTKLFYGDGHLKMIGTKV